MNSKMETRHNIWFKSSTDMTSDVQDCSVDLVVTSPPYPMVEMWDYLSENNDAFADIHGMLDTVWKECFRVMKPGAYLCINIGDAVRTVNDRFRIYNNAMRISQMCEKLGFVPLPPVIWKKPTNSPNKFMGSGMLPAGAYVTLEHEFILIFRKGTEKRTFNSDEDKLNRRKSAYFWEERNIWFSDIWNVTGTAQHIKNSESRKRNASYPLEIPYRLINMFSVYGDTVLDPFLGLGTTVNAAALLGRNSIGFEIDKSLPVDIWRPEEMNDVVSNRLERHRIFIDEYEKKKNALLKYYNKNLDCRVMTKQETDIQLYYTSVISKKVDGDRSHISLDVEYRRVEIQNRLI